MDPSGHSSLSWKESWEKEQFAKFFALFTIGASIFGERVGDSGFTIPTSGGAIKISMSKAEFCGVESLCVDSIEIDEKAMASLILGFIVEQYEYDPFLNMVGYNAVRDAADLLVGNPFEGILAETFLDADAYYYGKYLNDELNLALSRAGETVGIASTLAELMGGGGSGGSLATATITGGTIVVVSGEVALVISRTLILTSGSAIVEAKASQNSKENLEKS